MEVRIQLMPAEINLHFQTKCIGIVLGKTLICLFARDSCKQDKLLTLRSPKLLKLATGDFFFPQEMEVQLE